ncbi:MAG: CPXCG motif-containing cysteine-rich protein [Gemmatimonadetes bacterium]|nr:MAG: CPXCG motif-containing cysteine-rich protein [Gemmatimonadota bacterium]
MSVERDGSGPDPLDDDDFPPGDGTTETRGIVICPHCGEENEIGLDPGGGPTQEYVEDCQVCCRPWRVTVRYGPDGGAEVFAEPLDE